MKIKLSNYVAEFLVRSGITDVFTLTGGGAMHLNDALGHQEGLRCMYNHHEQACAIAAESYARIHNKIAAVCVTTGPGGTNAMTGVVGGYLDSIPMLVLSGQVRYDTTARSTGLNLRAMGDQEFDIIKSAAAMTKYCEMITDPTKIRYCLEKALHLAYSGRPGPCWLDIPLDVQGAYVDTEQLVGYDTAEYDVTLPPKPKDDQVGAVIDKIMASKRPVLYPGNGVRIAGAHEALMRVVDKLNIPVVTTWNGIDQIHDDHPLYVGRGGGFGDRPGNFAVQNSDLVLAIGNRLSVRQVSYNHETWAREAYVIMVDIDEEEMKKTLSHVDMPIWSDAGDFIELLDRRLPEGRLFNNKEWLERCADWKRDYPVVLPRHYEDTNQTNVYCFIKELSQRLPEGRITVVGNGSACVVGSHGYVIKKGQRFIINSAIASMGYDLPAAIGASVAAVGEEIVCVTGDGSIQMNLQELQTIIHHKMPIKLFVINNDGYHSIRQTQKNFFSEPLVGIGYDSGDLSFPSMEKLSAAYGYPYYSVHGNRELGVLDVVLAQAGPVICEIFVSREQAFEPKSATRKLEDGRLISVPLEDLAPFLDRDELRANMIIPMIEE